MAASGVIQYEEKYKATLEFDSKEIYASKYYSKKFESGELNKEVYVGRNKQRIPVTYKLRRIWGYNTPPPPHRCKTEKIKKRRKKEKKMALKAKDDLFGMDHNTPPTRYARPRIANKSRSRGR